MMTYLKEEQILFSSDGFGAHLASSEHFDDGLPDLPPGLCPAAEKVLCQHPHALRLPGHPALRQDCPTGPHLQDHRPGPRPDLPEEHPDWVLEAYQRWAAGTVEPKALVIYDTMWHSTELLAQAFTQGLMDAGVEAQMHHLRCTHPSDIITEVLDAGPAPVRLPHPQQPDVPHHGPVFELPEGPGPQKQGGRGLRLLRLERPGRGPDHQGTGGHETQGGPRGLQSQIYPRPRRTGRRPGPGRKTGEGESDRLIFRGGTEKAKAKPPAYPLIPPCGSRHKSRRARKEPP